MNKQHISLNNQQLEGDYGISSNYYEKKAIFKISDFQFELLNKPQNYKTGNKNPDLHAASALCFS